MASLLTNDTAASASSNSALAPRAVETKAKRPPWSDFDGVISIKLDELELESGQVLTELKTHIKISEALLSVKDITATFKGGELFGQANVIYDPTQSRAYRVASSSFLNTSIPRSFQKELIVNFQFKGSSMAS